MKQESTNTGFVILISLVATIGGFLFGFDSGVINVTVDGLKKAFNSDSVATGFHFASMFLVCFVGAFFALVSAFFVVKYTRETKGLELEDMQG